MELSRRGRQGWSPNIDVREALFLQAYYGEKSTTKGNGVESALAAGYSDSVAHTRWPVILKKFGNGGFKDSLRAVGITKPYLAMKMKHILDHGDDKEQLAAVRMILSNLGETTDQTQGGNTFNAPVMVIVGASAERMKALKEASYQPTREELEQQENDRCQAKLDQLKSGVLEPLVGHSSAGGGPKRIRLYNRSEAMKEFWRQRRQQKVLDVRPNDGTDGTAMQQVQATSDELPSDS